MFKYSLIACFIGFFIDLIIGDPIWFYHPIRLVGNLIVKLEKFFRCIFPKNDRGLLLGGFFLTFTVCLITTTIVFIILFFSYKVNLYFGVFIESIICYFIIATKSLKTESMKVYYKLSKNDIEGARFAVSMIVGRDTKNLDKKGIIKATVETVAENLSDGVIAPLIFMLIGGGVFGAFYKAINTMDSMIGYKNEKYIKFGKCSAKLDDIVNFFPSRISAIILIFASFICRQDYKSAFVIFKRDRFNHASPNSAQTESACAGALNIQLAGDAYYFGKLYKKPFIGDDIKEINEQHIVIVNKLMYVSAFSTLLLFGGLLLFMHITIGGDFF